MRRGGVRSIQPGIESLSDEVLRLMRKGVTAFQNIQLLRWCRELDIECAWNILAGFPGESPSEYERMATLIPSLAHLQPPCSCAQLRLDRFSPFHSQPAEFGFAKVRPARAYYFVYPFGRRELTELAYFFEFDYRDDRDVASYLEPVIVAVQSWWDGWTSEERPVLDARLEGDRVIVRDTRPVARTATYEVTGLRARLLLQCDRATSVTALQRWTELVCEESELVAAVDSLVDDGLVARRGGQLVSLVVLRDRPTDHLLGLRSNPHATGQASRPAALLHVGRPAGRER